MKYVFSIAVITRSIAPKSANDDLFGTQSVAASTASRPMTPGGHSAVGGGGDSGTSAQIASLREQLSRAEQDRADLRTEIGALKRKLKYVSRMSMMMMMMFRDEERRWQTQSKQQQNEYFNELLAMKKDYNYELERVKLQKDLELRQLKEYGDGDDDTIVMI